jgi:SAM-dependent methyltransferase
VAGSFALDLGCGSTLHRPVLEHAGFTYLGMDYQDPGAPMFADCQAIPLRAESCELVMSISMLQYVPDPMVVFREVYRVLKPGGWFLGTVAFLEPYNNTYFHHTHLGVAHLMTAAGLNVERLMVHPRWTVLRAQLALGLFPHMPPALARTLVAPLDFFHRAWWFAGRALRRRATTLNRVAATTGSVAFVGVKPAFPR